MQRTHPVTLFVVPCLELACFVAAIAILPFSVALSVAFVLLAAVFLSFALHISYHEVAHRFGRWPTAARLSVGLGLTALMGVSFHSYRIGHFNHHRFDNRLGDFTSTWKIVDGKPVRWGLLPYCLTWPRAYFTWPQLARSALQNGDATRGELLAAAVESLLPLGVVAGLLVWIPAVAVLYMLLIYAGWALVSLHNFGQHPPRHYDGEIEATSYSAPWYNRLTFNNGLHYEHHKDPGIPIAELVPDGAAPQVASSHLLAAFADDVRETAVRHQDPP